MKSDSKVSKKRKTFIWIIAISFILMLIIEILLIMTVIELASTCDIKRPYIPLKSSLIIKNNLSDTTDISICANYSALKTSVCLKRLLEGIYVYNITLDYEYNNFSQVDNYIRQFGGDCHESATWFTQAAEELGLESEYVDFTTSMDYSTKPITRNLHAVAIIADNDAYCIIDQVKHINCFEFKTKSKGDDNATG